MPRGIGPSPAVLRAVLAAGGRPANPGEFTMRAFLNGRIALTEAEAVLNVVSAQTSDGSVRALDDLRGDLTRRLEPARAAVIAALAYLDASPTSQTMRFRSATSMPTCPMRSGGSGGASGSKSGRLLSEARPSRWWGDRTSARAA